jgi:hypothetical protein
MAFRLKDHAVTPTGASLRKVQNSQEEWLMASLTQTTTTMLAAIHVCNRMAQAASGRMGLLSSGPSS